MALLRKSIRVWMCSLRYFSAEPHIPRLNINNLVKGGRRLVSIMQLRSSDVMLVKCLNNKELISGQRWLDIRKELITTTEFNLSEASVDMAIVNVCLDRNNMSAAMAYLQFLWDNGYTVNVSSMMTYLKICYIKTSPLLESEKDYLLKMYNTIREKYPVLDTLATECCIMGVSKTTKWRESLELLEMSKVLDKPRSGSYTAIICTAFEHDEPEIGWKYLHEVLEIIAPSHSTYIAYLDYCKRNFKGAELENAIEKMFDFWSELDIRPYVDVIIAYEEALSSLGWTTQHTSIREAGSCQSCSRKLTSLKVTDEQFAELAQKVCEHAIVGKDIYRRSTPEELKTFLDFVERTQPYDVVIDGLNVSYATKSSAKPDGSQLLEVFKMCHRRGKKVLVLGRKHMLKWTKLDINYMRNNGHVFLANDMSEDDPYMLYATLRSGSHTQIVSKDLMRQHKCLLGDKNISTIFKHWQTAHQLMPMTIKTGRGTKVYLKLPPEYLPVAQRDDDGFHIPYTTDVSLKPALTFDPPRSWVCFRKTKT